jgi:hypothetical protein
MLVCRRPHAQPRAGSIAFDGRTPGAGFGNLNDRAAAQVMGAVATDTSTGLIHVDIGEEFNEGPATQAQLAELGVADGSTLLSPTDC